MTSRSDDRQDALPACPPHYFQRFVTYHRRDGAGFLVSSQTVEHAIVACRYCGQKIDHMEDDE